ncbi:hypothetical protein D3C87_1812010 [compost metagenome]
MMKRASDVPPVVDSFGVAPVTASTAPESEEINALLRVRKTWLGRSAQAIS